MGTRAILASGLFLVFCLSIPSATTATTWHVPLDAPTIQAGIDSATAGDTVSVQCGTYHENFIEMKPGVHLRSETGDADCVTIDGDGLNKILYFLSGDVSSSLEGLTFTGGGGNNFGGAIQCWSASPSISKCVFVDNFAVQQGGAINFDHSNAQVADCIFLNNSAQMGGAVFTYLSVMSMTNCLFAGNSAQWHGGALWLGSMPSVTNCTVVDNAAGIDGAAVFLDDDAGANPHFTRTIIAFNTGSPAFSTHPNPTATLSCCDIYGNPEGDWVGPVASQLGVNGNVSTNPLFCDLSAGDYHLLVGSPCLGACGQMGVYGARCEPDPIIAGITDVPNDQGRQVRIRWKRGYYDAPGDSVDVESYEVYRYQGAFAAAKPKPDGGAHLVEGWDYIASAPAHGDSIYQLVAPTLCDSTIASGQCWSQFFVRAVTTDRFLYYDSAVDSGYSVDNLAPGVPAAFAVAYGPAGGNALSWESVPDADFQYYKVYRDTEAGFTPSPANLLHTTIDVEWLDAGGTQGHFYMISAVDHAGNEGDATGPETVTGVTQDPMPNAYALYQNAPNPFNPVTTIRYDLPSASPVTLVIYDVSGRRVRALKGGGVEPAGRRSVIWNGTSDAGTRVASGVYFYRLEAGSYTSTRRMVLLQ
ncbi:MAG: T9SS type A sorting domain-containing protein [Candidatus Krumholzibacteria bacterium]|nr:T9SS type A sorting domain-containing protein [Candidatus Krumholzibacteria bacterium]